MKRVIVDFKKLTAEVLVLLKEKYPYGYSDSDIITFKNAKNETIEAVEVRSEDTIYLVKISAKLEQTIEDFDLEDYEDDDNDGDIDVSGLDVADDEDSDDDYDD